MEVLLNFFFKILLSKIVQLNCTNSRFSIFPSPSLNTCWPILPGITKLIITRRITEHREFRFAPVCFKVHCVLFSLEFRLFINFIYLILNHAKSTFTLRNLYTRWIFVNFLEESKTVYSYYQINFWIKNVLVYI